MSSRENLVVPVFIPHRGCPHQCVFCNQEKITGESGAPSPEEVREFLEAHLGPGTPHAVVAYYGGSFTCMPEPVQEVYLDAARVFVEKGFAGGIRLSTRPDCMDARTAEFLKGRGVLTVELGVQSMDDAVLEASARGHTTGDSRRAAAAVKEAGLVLGIQLMAGLPGDTGETFIESVNKAVLLGPDFVRIYPTLVVKGSPLAAMHARGSYEPLSLSDATRLCAEAAKLFDAAGIPVVRMGLQPARELEEALVAGPYHPAFGHMVRSRLALERMSSALTGRPARAEFIVNPSELSVYKGIGGENARRLREVAGLDEVVISADKSVEKGGLVVRSA